MPAVFFFPPHNFPNLFNYSYPFHFAIGIRNYLVSASDLDRAVKYGEYHFSFRNDIFFICSSSTFRSYRYWISEGPLLALCLILTDCNVLGSL